jgi:hypothetical protein
MISVYFNCDLFVSEINKYLKEYNLYLISFNDTIDNVSDRMFTILKNTSNIGLFDDAKIEENLTTDMITFENMLYFMNEGLSIFEYYRSKSTLLSMIFFLCKTQIELNYYEPQNDFMLCTIQSFNENDELLNQ